MGASRDDSARESAPILHRPEKPRARKRHTIYVILAIPLLLGALHFPATGGGRRIILEDGVEMWGPIVAGVVVLLGVLLFVRSLPVKGVILLLLGLIPMVLGWVIIGEAYPYKLPVGGSLLAVAGGFIVDAGIGMLLRNWLAKRKLRKDARASLRQ